MATVRLQSRRDTLANWTTHNPILGSGEHGFETDTGYERIGDGSTAFLSLGRRHGAYIHYDDYAAFKASTEGSRGVGAIWLGGDRRYEEAASGAADHDETNVGGVKFYDLQKRTAKAAGVLAAQPDGYIGVLDGLSYLVDSTATGAGSATNDLSVDGLIPLGRPYIEYFGEVDTAPDYATDAIQAAFDYVESSRGTVWAKNRHYVVTRSIEVPSFVTFEGDSKDGTVINNQWTILAAPQFVNKDPASFIYTTFRNIVFRGGTHGVKTTVTGENAYNNFENCVFELQTAANLSTNKLLQTTMFLDCAFDGAPYGVVCEAWTANLNNFYNCTFTNHAWNHVRFVGASEVNNFIGCQFENGGVGARDTIYLEDPRNNNFIGCYFESTHTSLITETGSDNSTFFDKCHFTGANVGAGFVPYTFTSDGIINFGHNTWGTASDGPAKMSISGTNGGALGTGKNDLLLEETMQSGRFIAGAVSTPATLQLDLLEVSRTASTGALTNIQRMVGELTVNFYVLESGGFEASYSEKFLITVVGVGLAVLSTRVSSIHSDNVPRSSTLTIQAKSGATLDLVTIEAVITGMVPATEDGSSFSYKFDWSASSTLSTDTFTVTQS